MHPCASSPLRPPSSPARRVRPCSALFSPSLPPCLPRCTPSVPPLSCCLLCPRFPRLPALAAQEEAPAIWTGRGGVRTDPLGRPRARGCPDRTVCTGRPHVAQRPTGPVRSRRPGCSEAVRSARRPSGPDGSGVRPVRTRTVSSERGPYVRSGRLECSEAVRSGRGPSGPDGARPVRTARLL